MGDIRKTLYDLGKDDPEFLFYHNAIQKDPYVDLDELEKQYKALHNTPNRRRALTPADLAQAKSATITSQPTKAQIRIAPIRQKSRSSSAPVAEDILQENKMNIAIIKSYLNKLQPQQVIVFEATDSEDNEYIKVALEPHVDQEVLIWRENDMGDVATTRRHNSVEDAAQWLVGKVADKKPQVLNNKYLSLDEDWQFEGREITKYIDLYVCFEKFDSYMEENEFLIGCRDALDEVINQDTDYVSVDLGEVEGKIAIVPVFAEIDAIPDLGEIYADELLEPSFADDYNLNYYVSGVRDKVERIRHIVLGDLAIINDKLPEFAEEWGFKKAANKRAPITEGYSGHYKNKRGEDVVDLEYNDLHVEFDYGPRDWETGTGTEYFDGEIDYTYTVDKQSIDEFLVDLDDLYNDYPEFAKAVDADDYDGYYGFIDDHFDELVEKYYDKILEHFRDDAEREAVEETDPEEYLSRYEPDYDGYDD